MDKTIWVVGKSRGFVRVDGKSSSIWDINGVFDDEAKAIEACGDRVDYFIGPIPFNKALPDETVDWVGCYYPNAAKGQEMQQPRKLSTIVVNGIEVKTDMFMATYTDILMLTDLPLRNDYTMTWSDKIDKGIMRRGGKPVLIKDGMIFNAVLTGDA